MVNYPWVILKYDVNPNEMICERCGAKQKMPEGNVLMNVYIAMLKAFGKDHKTCKMTPLNNGE